MARRIPIAARGAAALLAVAWSVAAVAPPVPAQRAVEVLEVPVAVVVPRVDGAIATGEWDDAAEAALAAPLTAEVAEGPEAMARRDVVAFRAKWDDTALYLALRGLEPPTPAQDAYARHLAGDTGVARPPDAHHLVESWRIRLDPRARGEGIVDAPQVPGRFELRFHVAWCPAGATISPHVVQAEAGYGAAELPRARRAEGWTPSGLVVGAFADPGLCVEVTIPFRELNARLGVIAGAGTIVGPTLERFGPPAPGEVWHISVERRYDRVLAASWGGVPGYPGVFGPRRGAIRFGGATLPGAAEALEGAPYRRARPPGGVGASGAPAPPASAATIAAPPEAGREAAPPWPPDGFTTNVGAAVARAVEERKLLLLLYSSAELERRRPQPRLWSLPPMQALERHFVFVLLDPTRPPPPGFPIAEARLLPQVIVMTPAGREAGRFDGRMGARELHEHLSAVARRPRR